MMRTANTQEDEKPHNFTSELPEKQAVTYSTFNTCKDIYPKQQSESFDDFADSCRKPAIRNAKDGAAFCPATFKSHRSNTNATECGFLAFDLDNLPDHVTGSDVLKCVDGLLSFAYSSHNHLMTGKGARYRVVVAIDSPIPADQYPTVIRAFAKRFPWAGAVDEKCFNTSRLFYFPSCAESRKGLFEYGANDGALLDWKTLANSSITPPLIKPLKSGSSPFADIPSNLVPAVDLIKLAEALEFIEPEEYGVWLNVGMGLRELHQEGFLMWEKWSSQSSKYTGKAELLQKWSSFQPGGGVGFGTIFHLAKLNGFVMHPHVVKHLSDENFSRGEFEMPKAFTELAVAEAIQKTFGGGFHYIAESGKWLVSDGSSGLWVEDSTGQIKRWMFGLFRYAKEQSFDLLRASDDRGKKVLSEVLKAEKSHFVSGSMQLMQALQGVTIKAEMLDSDIYLVGFRGGKCVDLRTGEIRGIQQNDYLTKTLGVAYQEGAKCDLWERVILEWCCGDVELARFLRVFVGYCLSGETTFQGFLFFHGQGRNGKSVFVQIIESLLGDYAKTLNPETLMLKHGDGGTNNDIARLAGARFVKSVELPEERQLNENLVKQMVGGDTLTARFLYGEWFELKPQFKLVIVGNHRPVIRGTDEGVWRRVHLVPFNALIEDVDVDPDLTAKLIEELPGVLRWALDGWKVYQKEGLKIPEAVKAESKAYRNDSDIVGRFLNECCLFGGQFETTSKELFYSFKFWCEESNLKAGSNISFGRRLEGRLRKRKGRDCAVYEGVKVKFP